MKKILSLIVLNLFAFAPIYAQYASSVQSSEGTELFERGYKKAWTSEDASKWGVPTTTPDIVGTEYVEGYGLHTGPYDHTTYIRIAAVASDTVATVDPSRGILTIDAQWVSYGSLGRSWFDDTSTKALLNCAYFRIGNVYLMQNAQAKNMAYSTDGLATYNIFDIEGMTGQNNTTGVNYPWSGRDTSVVNIPFINIHMQIDMPHNKLVSMQLSRADVPDSILYEVKNIDIKGQDWESLVLESGFHKSKSIAGSPNEYLKALRVVETSQTGDKASYTIRYMLDSTQVDETETRQAFVGEKIAIPETFWLTDSLGNKTKYFVKDPQEVLIQKNTMEGPELFLFDVRKANIYSCKVISDFGKVLVDQTVVEGEDAPWVYWNKFVKNDEDGSWYETQAPFGFQASNANDTSVVVSFTKSDITYFYDTADMFVYESHTGISAPQMVGTRYSGGSTQRHLVYDPTWYSNEKIVDGGVFEVSVPWINGHTSSSYIELDTYSGEIRNDTLIYEVGKIDPDYITDESQAGITADSRASGITTIKGFEVPVNSGILLQYFGSDNSNACLDYISLKWLDYLKETVSMKDEMANNRTQQKSETETPLRGFVCDKNYIFSKNDAITAFYLKDIRVSDKSIVAELDTIIGAVPVGTVCVLAGEAGAITRVPYVNHSEFSYTPVTETVGSAVWTKQLSVTADGAGAEASSAKAFCLEMIDGIAKFVEVENPAKVPDGVVYYTVPTKVMEDNSIDAKSVMTLFEGGEPVSVTGIRSINNGQQTTVNYYNIAGQRVNASAKGLLISNGKKYMNK